MFRFGSLCQHLLRSASLRAIILLLVLGVSLMCTVSAQSDVAASVDSQSFAAAPGQRASELSESPQLAHDNMQSSVTGATTTSDYYNWSGYAVTGTTKPFVSVESTFIQPTVTCPAPTVSSNDTVVPNDSSASIKDNAGNTWTVTGGIVKENGVAAGLSVHVIEIAYVNNVVWQENSSNLWWPWTGTAWLPGNGTAISPLTGITTTTSGDWTQFWVGFDGYQNNTVEQAGTGAQCSMGSKPTPYYYAWWEMYPTNNIQVMPLTIKPGNKIEATATYISSNGDYDLIVSDLTTSQHYTKVTKCATKVCARQSAEWIVERPATNKVYTPLADWGSMILTADEAANTTTTNTRTKVVTPVMKPISAFPDAAIDMINDPYTGETLANVGPLNSTGEAFTDTWDAAQ